MSNCQYSNTQTPTPPNLATAAVFWSVRRKSAEINFGGCFGRWCWNVAHD